jgi:hypothetical protein
MRIVAAGCLAALGLGLAVSAASAQEEKPKYAPKAADLSWFTGWFGGGGSPPGVSTTPPKPAPGEPAPLTIAQRAEEQDRLMKAYLRRLDVCDRLREVAQESSDDRLLKEAGRLEELAWRLYQTRSSKLLGVAGLAGDEETAEEKPGPSTAELLLKSSPGGALPPRLRQGGRLEPSRAEVPASRKED